MLLVLESCPRAYDSYLAFEVAVNHTKLRDTSRKLSKSIRKLYRTPYPMWTFAVNGAALLEQYYELIKLLQKLSTALERAIYGSQKKKKKTTKKKVLRAGKGKGISQPTRTARKSGVESTGSA